jgi:VCBS repeat-containing protein
VTNPVPVAVNDVATTAYLTPVTAKVGVNDTDADGDALSFSKLTDPKNGTVTVAVDGTYVYTPKTGFSGTDSFTYQVKDADGATATATVTITVENAGPLVTAIAAQNGVDFTAFTLNAGSSFSDPNGDKLTFSATGLPKGLSIDPVTGIISGTLDKSASVGGPYSVTVTAKDPSGASIATTFALAVTNPVPVAVNDVFVVVSGEILTGDVGLNDSDPDQDGLGQFKALSTPQHGRFQMAADGRFTYEADPVDLTTAYGAGPAFTYQTSDAQGATAQAAVTLHFAPRVITPERLYLLVTDNVGTITAMNTNGLPFQIVDPDSSEMTVTLTVTNGRLRFPDLLGLQIQDRSGGLGRDLQVVGSRSVINQGLTNLVYETSKVIDDVIRVVAHDEGGRSSENVAVVGVELSALGGLPKAGVDQLIDFTPTSVRPRASSSASLIQAANLVTNALGKLEVQIVPVGKQDGSVERTEVELEFVRPDGTIELKTVPVVIYQPLLASAQDAVYGPTFDQPIFNPQTGVYEQKVRVVNNTPFEFNGFRLYPTGLPAQVKLWNRTGSDAGGDYVEFTGTPVPANGGQQVITLEYFNSTFKPFAAPLRLELIQAPGGLGDGKSALTGTTVPVTAHRGYTPDLRAKFYLQFQTRPGKTYVVQYSDALPGGGAGSWSSSPVQVSGNGNLMQWMDDGPPSTRSLPFTDSIRLYRVVELNP